MSAFAKFEAKYGRPEPSRRLTQADLVELNGRVPPALLAYYGEVGVGRYSDGLFRTVDPRVARPLIEPYEEPKALDSTFFITAFGDFAYFHEGRMTLVMPFLDTSMDWWFDPTNVFNVTLVDANSIKNLLLRPVFRAASKRLGPPDDDECFGFFPAIPLGGKIDAGAVKRVKLREHLAILRQLGE
jgi:hypothetical protein